MKKIKEKITTVMLAVVMTIVMAGALPMAGAVYAEDSLVIPDETKTIEGDTYVSQEYTSVTFPAGIENIEEAAFTGCEMGEMIFLGNVPDVENKAFDSSHVDSIVVPYDFKDKISAFFDDGGLEWNGGENITYTYKVSYSFVCATPGRGLPVGATSQLPKSTYEKPGTVITPETPIKVVGLTDQLLFQHWDAASKTVGTSEVTFVGTWEWSEIPKHAVTYSFVSGTEGVTLPAAVIDQLPQADEVLEGCTVTPDFEFTPVEDDNYTWTFAGWTPESRKMKTEDLSFVGTWNCEPKSPIVNDDVKGGKGSDDNAVKTSDVSASALWIIIIIGAFTAMAYGVIKIRKESR